jgi:hypothetical protein
MTSGKIDMLSLVFEAVDKLNEELPPAMKLEKKADAELIGGGGYIDSLQLINFLLFLDDIVTQQTGIHLSLMEDTGLLKDMGPLRSFGALASYLDECLAAARQHNGSSS